MTLIPEQFIRYKFINSLFLGISIGAIFTLYAPLEPSVYSLGGVLLAFGMLAVARLYEKILNIQCFFGISLFVELTLLGVICYFLLFSYSYTSALIIYIGYQLTFVFGSYLVRIETLLLKEEQTLKALDTAKQLGYLVGMGVSYLFYQLLSHYAITENQEQVYYLHYLLLLNEIAVIVWIFRSFRRE